MIGFANVATTTMPHANRATSVRYLKPKERTSSGPLHPLISGLEIGCATVATITTHLAQHVPSVQRISRIARWSVDPQAFELVIGSASVATTTMRRVTHAKNATVQRTLTRYNQA